MIYTTVIQIAGSIALLMISSFCVQVARRDGLCEYTKEFINGLALMCFLLFISRSSTVPFEFLSQTDARTLSSLILIVFVPILGQNLFLHHQWHRLRKQREA